MMRFLGVVVVAAVVFSLSGSAEADNCAYCRDCSAGWPCEVIVPGPPGPDPDCPECPRGGDRLFLTHGRGCARDGLYGSVSCTQRLAENGWTNSVCVLGGAWGCCNTCPVIGPCPSDP